LDDPTNILGGHIDPIAPSSPAAGALDADGNDIGDGTEPGDPVAHALQGDRQRPRAGDHKAPRPSSSDGPTSTANPSLGLDAEPGNFRVVAPHAAVSTTVSNRAMAMPARDLRRPSKMDFKLLLGSGLQPISEG